MGALRFNLDRGVLLEPQTLTHFKVILAEKGTHFVRICLGSIDTFFKLSPCGHPQNFWFGLENRPMFRDFFKKMGPIFSGFM